ncbi:hypothetical protein Cgig2_019937 [Carnegiea gigantea]|uniref:Endonuclease/exonuclease/phosphatase domain-containing protein n=1 Tax=Carnegiea gigantea TaxID=171969 RepID=A0A9Q1JH90_9CARY|nr:hypothetical protein Cgig2_019937 [Carnegiea gigantea]
MFGHTQKSCRKKEHQRLEWRVRSQEISQEQNQPSERVESRGDNDFQLATTHITRHYVPRTERQKETTTLDDLLYQVTLILKTDQLIHGEPIHLSTNKKFYITFVYGRNLDEQRIPLWEDLIALSQTLEDPWCVLGDFNSVLHEGKELVGLMLLMEKSGTLQHASHIVDCKNFAIVWSRIDRALYNELWYEVFAYTHMHCMSQGMSDHTPIVLSFPHGPKPRYTFQFCDMWTKNKGFRDMVKHSLAQIQNGSKLKALQEVLYNLKHPFKQLSQSRYADIYVQQARARNELLQTQAQLQQDPFDIELLQKEASSRENYIATNH